MKKQLFFLLIPLFLLPACDYTYKRDNMTQSIKELAKKEYNHDVQVAEVGETIGIQLTINNLLAELVAEDQLLWTHMEELMMVLSRVVLSSDSAPEFIVLDVVDEENPHVHLIFTRYVKDLKKLMGEALSRTSFLDRLLMEFVIGDERVVFDPYELDMVQLMMMAADTLANEKAPVDEVWLKEVDFPVFLSKVTANTMRRIFREEKKIKRDFLLRKITTTFDPPGIDKTKFKILLDLVLIPGSKKNPQFLEKTILPRVAKEAQSIFKSYRFNRFAEIVIVERNSGSLLVIGKK